MSDPWLGTDKLLHCLACAAITSFTYSLLRIPKSLRGRHRARIAGGCLAGCLAGVAKEVGDSVQLWPFCPCGASARDLVADALGVVLGVLLVLLVQFCCSRHASGGSGDAQPAPAAVDERGAAATA
jgi:hypothetical protein